MAEAMGLAKRDPELSRWFENHCAVQEILRAKFRQIAVPQGLKEQIISERKAHTTLRSHRNRALMAVAAAMLLLIVAVAYRELRPRQSNSFANFSNRMIGTVARGQYPQMLLETNDLQAIHAFLTARGQGDYSLPEALAKTAGTGCTVLHWQGQNVSMVCFNSGRNADAAEPDLFLFVVDRDGLARAPTSTSPHIEARNRNLTIASWRSGNKIYLLGGLGGENFLRKYL